MLILSSKGEIIFEEENCLDVSKSYAGAPVEILKCHGMGGNQKWEHSKASVSQLLAVCRWSGIFLKAPARHRRTITVF